MSTGFRNIGGDPNDGSYRYKMPRMLTRVEGRGNGIKTRIVNMNDIAKAIHRKPEYVTKFFGCELGAQSKCVEKTGLSVVNGNHDTPSMDTLLDDFIKGWVLCPNCHLPETELSVKGGAIFADCNACGHHSPCDMRSRLAVYIVKDPPKINEKKKMDKKAKREQQDEEIYKQTSELKVTPADNESWTISTDHDAVENRQKDADKSLEVVHQTFESVQEPEWVEELKKMLASDRNVKEKKHFLHKIQRKEELGNLARTNLIFYALLANSNILKTIPKPSTIELLKATISDPRCQKAFLTNLCDFLSQFPDMLKRICDVLSTLEVKGVLVEKVILEWWNDSSMLGHLSADDREATITAIKPFIEYLQDEEEEEDEEEDDEEDDDE